MSYNSLFLSRLEHFYPCLSIWHFSDKHLALCVRGYQCYWVVKTNIKNVSFPFFSWLSISIANTSSELGQNGGPDYRGFKFYKSIFWKQSGQGQFVTAMWSSVRKDNKILPSYFASSLQLKILAWLDWTIVRHLHREPIFDDFYEWD